MSKKDYAYYYPLLRPGPTKDYVDKLVREGKEPPSMMEVELRTSYEASAQYRTAQQKRRDSKNPRDLLLMDILHNIRFYSGLTDADRIEEYEDKLIDMLNTWINW
jgi:hypothetical protein